MTGWAIKDARTGELDISTVSPHRRGALVNWLYTARRVPIHNAMADELIELIWNEHSAGETRACAVMVRIEEVGRS